MDETERAAERFVDKVSDAIDGIADVCGSLVRWLVMMTLCVAVLIPTAVAIGVLWFARKALIAVLALLRSAESWIEERRM